MKQREHLVVTVGLLACPIAFLLLSTGLSAMAAFVPAMIAVPTAILIAVQWGRDLRSPAIAATGARERSIALSMVALLPALYLFGFLATLPVYAGFQWRTRAEGTWRGAFAIAIGLLAALYGGLVRLLHAELFEGVLWDWFSS